MVDAMASFAGQVEQLAGATKPARNRAGEALKLCEAKVTSFEAIKTTFASLRTAYDGITTQMTTAHRRDQPDGPWSIVTDGRTVDFVEAWHDAGTTATDALKKARTAANETVAWCDKGRDVFDSGHQILSPTASWLAALDDDVPRRHVHAQGLRHLDDMAAVLRGIDELKGWAETTADAARKLHLPSIANYTVAVEQEVGRAPATITSLVTTVEFVRDEFNRLRSACDQLADEVRRPKPSAVDR
ncbi:MAG TPA: hypothetical protein VIP77_18515 [Jiangellaceae bacterium]